MLFIGVIPAFILLFGMIFRADTPRWLVLNGFENKAKLVLQKLSFGDDIDAEILKIKNLQNDKKEMVFEKKLFKPLIIGIGIMFFQIATGINSIIYYAPVIFKMTGFAANEDAILVTILIGVINFLMTFVAIILVDRIGRKPLLYFGLFGMLIGLIVLAGVFAFDFPYNKLLSVLSVIVYIVSFSASLGPIALLLISEIFPLKYRGRAMGVAIVSNFVFNFIVTGAFPILLDKIGGCATFLIFAFIVILAFLFVYFCVPETKGKSLEDIEMQC